MSEKAETKQRLATPRLAIGSKRFQPVARISAPASAVPAKPARSVVTCRKAPRMLMLSDCPRESTSAATRLTTAPAIATTSTIPPRTSGVRSAAARPSRRSSPDQKQRDAVCLCRENLDTAEPERPAPARRGRAAMPTATIASARASTSVSMWPASARRASERAIRPKAISTAITVAAAPAQRAASGDRPGAVRARRRAESADRCCEVARSNPSTQSVGVAHPSGRVDRMRLGR